MLIDKIAIIGVGQCGSNLTMELENLGFNSFYVNTSLEDLDTINTDRDNKFHIKGKGMAKDRSLAMECIISDNNAENIADAIHNRYAMADILYICYSLSGGTGGTMGNVIAEVTSDLYQDKVVNVVAVLPKSSEDIGLQANAIESLKHLKTLQESGAIAQVHLLDNNSREDIFSINKDFAICLDRFVSFNEITKMGNLDEEERERLLIESGMAVILEFSDDDFANGLAQVSTNSIYSEWLKDPKLHGLILNKKQNKDINKELIKEVIGMPNYTHQSSWDEDSNVLFSVGMSFNDNILIKMKKDAQEMLDKKKELEEKSKKEKMEDVDFNASDIIKSTSKRRRTTTTVAEPRKRGERKASSALDKYRNM